MDPINVLCHTSNTESQYNIKEDSVSLSLVQFKLFRPHIGHQKCYTVDWDVGILCLRYTELPDIWLGQVSYKWVCIVSHVTG